MGVDRILTTHVGSLLRPPGLKEDLVARAQGRHYDPDAFASKMHEAIDEVVRNQVACGIDIVDDGEFGKTDWITYLYRRVAGVELRKVPVDRETVLAKHIPPGLLDRIPRAPAGIDPASVGGYDLFGELFRFTTYSFVDYAAGEATGWYCTGPIVYDPSELDRQLATLRHALEGVDAIGGFVPAVSPASIYYIVNEFYDTEEEFVFAMADALHLEYQRIVDAGFDLHVDDAVLWHKYATIKMSGGTERDYARWAEVRIEALNHALRGIPIDRVRYHICSGSGHTTKVFDPSLRDILPFVMRANWGMLLFEQGNVGHEHEWTVWRDVELPDDRVLVPGVVTHQTQMIEHPELVAQRLIRLAEIVGRERVMAGTDCGFAQTATITRADPWTQWAKLRALSDGAALASERLW
jgi:5-methyltetrahydropteroyltriglutamate--homocysteine methyltransferase